MATDSKQDFGKIREEATEDLFDRSAEYQTRKQEKPEDEIRDHLKTPGEELFLQNIQQGSGEASEEDLAKSVGKTGAESSANNQGVPSQDIDTEGDRGTGAAAATGRAASEDATPGQQGNSNNQQTGETSPDSGRSTHTGKSAWVERADGSGEGSTAAESVAVAASSTPEVQEEAGQGQTQQSEQTVNLAPTDIVLSATEVAENAEPGSIVATMEAIDSDSTGPFEFTLANDPSGNFEIVGNQLLVKADADLDYESSQLHLLTIQVVDDSGNSFSKEFSVDVIDVNEAPEAVADASSTTENASIKVDVLANDTDVDHGHTFTLDGVSNVSGKGSVSIVDGQLQFDPGTDFDYLNAGATEQVIVNYTMSDEHGLESSNTFTITVTGTDDSPVVSGTHAGMVIEDGFGTASGTLSISDVDEGDYPSFTSGTIAGIYGSLTMADDGFWTYELNDASVQSLDAGDTATDTITLTASDGTEHAITISINGTEDLPTLDVVSTVSVDEDGSKTISFTAKDVDGAVTTTASATHGEVTVDNDSGEITYQPDVDYFGSDTITLTTTDDDGAFTVKTVAVTVNGIDDSAEAPALSASVGDSEVVHAVVEQSLTIDNPSFETSNLADGGWNLTTPGWQQQQGYSGTFNPADAHLEGGASDGENSAFLVRNASISQEIDATLESGNSYSLQVDVGDRGDMDSPPDYQINLYAGDQLIGSVTEEDFPTTDDAFITATLAVDTSSLADDFSGFGENLRIELVNNSSLQTNFDDVRLTTSEPGAPDTIRYPLDIDASLTDTDGSETLSIKVDNLPDGAVLSAGTENSDGSWTLEPGETSGLMITVPIATRDFSLDISATSTESLGGDTTTVSAQLPVAIPELDTTAEAPELSAIVGTPSVNYQMDQTSITVDNSSFEANALGDGAATRSIQDWVKEGVNGTFDPSSRSFGSGASDGENTGWVNRNSSISQQVDATLESGKSYTLQVDVGDRGDIANVPDYEIRLYAGNKLLGSVSEEEFPTTDDGFITATLSIDTDSLPDDFSGFGENLRIELFNGSSIQTNFDNVRLSEGIPGEPQSLSYSLDIDAALTDTDGSEALSISVDGLPDGAVLSAGTQNEDGSWTLSPDETDGVTITVPLDAGDFTLNVSATSTEALGHLGSGKQGTTTKTRSLNVADLNISPTLDLEAVLPVDSSLFSSGNDRVNLATEDANYGEEKIYDAMDGNDTVTGGDANDNIIGGAGYDTQYGGGGDDNFVVDAANAGSSNYYSGGAGTDRITAQDGEDVVVRTLRSSESIEEIVGEGDTALKGTGSGDNIDLSGTTMTGIDHIDAGAGNDTVVGSQGDDTIIGGAGNDRA